MRELAICALLMVSQFALAQEPPLVEPAARLGEIRERLRAYEHDANNRQNLLGRKMQVLQLLADGIDSISGFGAGFAVDRARQKLDEAHKAASDASLGDPVPAVLGALEELLARPGTQSADELRRKAFVTISR